jgi:hypothetical protein
VIALVALILRKETITVGREHHHFLHPRIDFRIHAPGMENGVVAVVAFVT